MEEEVKYLRLLSIFYYIVGGLAAFFASFPLIHVVLGFGMLFAGTGSPDGPPVNVIAGIFLIGVGLTFILLGWTFVVLMIITGRNLKAFRKHTFCVVMAGVSCIFIPFGTVLGVLSLILLTRESVKKLFDQNESLPVD